MTKRKKTNILKVYTVVRLGYIFLIFKFFYNGLIYLGLTQFSIKN